MFAVLLIINHGLIRTSLFWHLRICLQVKSCKIRYKTGMKLTNKDFSSFVYSCNRIFLHAMQWKIATIIVYVYRYLIYYLKY